MLKSLSRKVVIGACGVALFAGCLLPAQKVHASRHSTAIAIFSGIAGAMIGAGLERASHERRKPYCHHRWPQVCPASTTHQKYLMKRVLANYNPAFHDMWVEHVMIDLMDQLTPAQQDQLLRLMEQRRCSHCAPYQGRTACMAG